MACIGEWVRGSHRHSDVYWQDWTYVLSKCVYHSCFPSWNLSCERDVMPLFRHFVFSAIPLFHFLHACGMNSPSWEVLSCSTIEGLHRSSQPAQPLANLHTQRVGFSVGMSTESHFSLSYCCLCMISATPNLSPPIPSTLSSFYRESTDKQLTQFPPKSLQVDMCSRVHPNIYSRKVV